MDIYKCPFLRSAAISFLIKSKKSGSKHNAVKPKIINPEWLHPFFLIFALECLGTF